METKIICVKQNKQKGQKGRKGQAITVCWKSLLSLHIFKSAV
jgi:hypothetical protein